MKDHATMPNTKPDTDKLFCTIFILQVIGLKTQLKYYTKVEAWLRHKLGDVECNNVLSRAVYLFNIGTNDYISRFLTNSTMLASSDSRSQYVDTVIGNLTSVVKVS